MKDIDATDTRILRLLQTDASVSLDDLSEQVGLSRNACWRRIKAMEETGVISRRVALVDPDKVGLPLTVFMMIRTHKHNPEWLEAFRSVTRSMPEILGAYRMTGDLDYVVRARIPDVASYDRLYRTLINKIELGDVSASFVMEELKESTALPV